MEEFALAKQNYKKGRSPQIKIVLYGDSGVGKSALMLRYVYDRFDFDIESTIGAAFNTKKVDVDGVQVVLEIWDTAGSERFNSIHPIYVRGAKVVLLCFVEPDVTSIKTKITKIKNINEEAEIVLVATKTDLERDHKYDALSAYAEKNKLGMFYTSSLKGTGVKELFQYVSTAGLKIFIRDAKNEEDKNLVKIEEIVVEEKTCCGYSSAYYR